MAPRISYGSVQIPSPDRYRGSSIREDSEDNPGASYKVDRRYNFSSFDDGRGSYREEGGFNRARALRAARAAKAEKKALSYRGASQGRQFGRNAAVAAERFETAQNEPTMEAPSVKRMASF
jgi:hypothetical protein